MPPVYLDAQIMVILSNAKLSRSLNLKNIRCCASCDQKRLVLDRTEVGAQCVGHPTPKLNTMSNQSV